MLQKWNRYTKIYELQSQVTWNISQDVAKHADMQLEFHIAKSAPTMSSVLRKEFSSYPGHFKCRGFNWRPLPYCLHPSTSTVYQWEAHLHGGPPFRGRGLLSEQQGKSSHCSGQSFLDQRLVLEPVWARFSIWGHQSCDTVTLKTVSLEHMCIVWGSPFFMYTVKRISLSYNKETRRCAGKRRQTM